MFADLNQLLALQQCDSLIDALKREVKQWPEAEKQAQARAGAAAVATESAHHALQEIEVALKRLEIDVETRRSTIARLKTQQYETRKNEEFRAMTSEIQRYEEEVDGLETNELEKMEAIDAARAVWESRKAEQALVEKEVTAEIEGIHQRLEEARVRLADAEAARETRAGEVPGDILEQYTRIARRNGATSVSPVRNGVCGGCHMKITHATAIALRHQTALVTCDQCERFIYVEDGLGAD